MSFYCIYSFQILLFWIIIVRQSLSQTCVLLSVSRLTVLFFKNPIWIFDLPPRPKLNKTWSLSKPYRQIFNKMTYEFSDYLIAKYFQTKAIMKHLEKIMKYSTETWHRPKAEWRHHRCGLLAVYRTEVFCVHKFPQSGVIRQFTTVHFSISSSSRSR